MMIWKIVLIVYNIFLLFLLISACLKTAQQGKRILDMEKRWAKLQRRQSMYSQLVKPSEKAQESMDEFGIEDIEKAAAAEKAKLRNHDIIID